MRNGPHRDRRRRTRLLATAGAACGAVLTAWPHQVVDQLCPEFPHTKVWAVRLLGGRLLAQHGTVLGAPSARVIRVASAIDLLHAVSMLPLVGSPRYGRAARISAAFATASAVLGTTWAASTPPMTPDDHPG